MHRTPIRSWSPLLKERISKRRLLLATLVAIVTTVFDARTYADLFVASMGNDQVLRYDETTGAFLDSFVTPRNGGLSSPRNLTFGPDGNLYVNSASTNSVKRYDGRTGAYLD